MFYEVFIKLCEREKIKPATVAREADFKKGSITYWKNQYQKGCDVRPDARILDRIAAYFHVSIDYLLERTNDPVDYSDGDLTAEVSGAVLDEFGGDVKKAVDFQRAVENDVKNEQAQTNNLYNLLCRLDSIDRVKAEAYIQGLLAADKYAVEVKKNA